MRGVVAREFFAPKKFKGKKLSLGVFFAFIIFPWQHQAIFLMASTNSAGNTAVAKAPVKKEVDSGAGESRGVNVHVVVRCRYL